VALGIGAADAPAHAVERASPLAMCGHDVTNALADEFGLSDARGDSGMPEGLNLLLGQVHGCLVHTLRRVALGSDKWGELVARGPGGVGRAVRPSRSRKGAGMTSAGSRRSVEAIREVGQPVGTRAGDPRLPLRDSNTDRT